MVKYSKPYLILAFYKYAPIADAEAYQKKHLRFCKQLGLLGRILVAPEGLNGTCSGTVEQCEQYMAYVRSYPEFADTEFKIDEADEQAFDKMHVRLKPEIVNSGLPARGQEDVRPWEQTGKHVSADEFKQLKDRDDVVILDVRSNYETMVGKFKNAVTLDIDNFREFPDKIDELIQYKDKKVITYCTGGIKCEKASAYLMRQGFSDVMQLDGGIIKYAKDGGGEDFEGKCYVFDKRVIVDVNTVNPKVITECVRCGTPTARVVNCSDVVCNAQVPLCEDCGWTYEGTCSDKCLHSDNKRLYDGTGYYGKPPARDTDFERRERKTAAAD